VDLLRPCIDSIISKTKYSNFSLLVVDNGSSEESTIHYLNSLRDAGIRVIEDPGSFNYSRICNFAIGSTDADYVCLLNNDTLIIDSDWLLNLLSHAIMPSVGVVGSVLTYPDGTIQHLGVQLGYRGVAGHVFSKQSFQSIFPGRTPIPCNPVEAVTFACALMKKSTWVQLGGLDETFRVGLNDVDFCLRARNFGLENIICGKSHLVHFESKSRKSMRSAIGAGVALIEVLRFMHKHTPFSR
jgi:GT2 family glycosyltransferase